MGYFELDIAVEEDKLGKGNFKFNLGSGQLKNFVAGKISNSKFLLEMNGVLDFLGKLD